MQVIGSQVRETLEESGCELEKRIDKDMVILFSTDIPPILELWVASDDYAGYVIEIDGVGYEYIRDKRE